MKVAIFVTGIAGGFCLAEAFYNALDGDYGSALALGILGAVMAWVTVTAPRMV